MLYEHAAGSLSDVAMILSGRCYRDNYSKPWMLWLYGMRLNQKKSHNIMGKKLTEYFMNEALIS